MKQPGGVTVVQALEDEGIRFAFGIPGTHNIELYDVLGQSESVRPVLVTDEQSASFMADAVWRASGGMACVNVVPGAGLTHAMSGIAEAFMDHVPMLVLGCGIRQDSGKAFQLHDVDQKSIIAPVVKATFRPETAEELYSAVREACHVARVGAPGPVFVEVPANLYVFTHAAGPRSWAPAHDDVPPLSQGLVAKAVEVLAGARRPLLYVGAGAAGATEEVLALAERLEAPVSTTFQGKGVFPEDHPLFLWPGFGSAAPRFVRDIAKQCDVTLAIGCRFGEVCTGSYGQEPPGTLVHVDIDSDALGRNHTTDVAIASDAGVFLRRLLEELGELSGNATPQPDEQLRSAIREGHAGVWKEWLGDVGGDLVTPAHLLRTAQRVFGPETIYTTDSGNGTFLAMECLRLQAPGRFLAPVDYSCMGYSIPAALGAKLARPDTPVVALAGDGAFMMTGLEMATGAAEGVGVIGLVLRDRELAQIAQFQSTAMNRKVASGVRDYELKHLAAGMRVDFLEMSDDDSVEEVLEEAHRISREGRPVLVEVAIDYSRKTFFTKGVVKANLGRLPLKDQVRFVGRALTRKITG